MSEHRTCVCGRPIAPPAEAGDVGRGVDLEWVHVDGEDDPYMCREGYLDEDTHEWVDPERPYPQFEGRLPGE